MYFSQNRTFPDIARAARQTREAGAQTLGRVLFSCLVAAMAGTSSITFSLYHYPPRCASGDEVRNGIRRERGF
jgi:hypothetical protein